MSIDQIFPTDLFEPGKREEFVSFLTFLPIPTRVRKQAYFEYLKLTNQVFDRKEIDRILQPTGA